MYGYWKEAKEAKRNRKMVEELEKAEDTAARGDVAGE